MRESSCKEAEQNTSKSLVTTVPRPEAELRELLESSYKDTICRPNVKPRSETKRKRNARVGWERQSPLTKRAQDAHWLCKIQIRLCSSVFPKLKGRSSFDVHQRAFCLFHFNEEKPWHTSIKMRNKELIFPTWEVITIPSKERKKEDDDKPLWQLYYNFSGYDTSTSTFCVFIFTFSIPPPPAEKNIKWFSIQTVDPSWSRTQPP